MTGFIQSPLTVGGNGRDLGLVHKRAGLYSSEETLFRRRGQKTRNRQMFEEVQAVNELGDQYTLADLCVSNPSYLQRKKPGPKVAGGN